MIAKEEKVLTAASAFPIPVDLPLDVRHNRKLPIVGGLGEPVTLPAANDKRGTLELKRETREP